MPRVIVEDFNDVGTWRAVENKGLVSGTWFAQGVFMGASELETSDRGRLGEIRFAFNPKYKGQHSVAFERYKASLSNGFLSKIGFEADSKGLPVSLRFVLADMDHNFYTTDSVPLSGEGWEAYTLDLNADTVPGWNEARPPLSLRRVVLEASEGISGSIYLDNISLYGEFPRKDLIAIKPVYEGISYAPEQSIDLGYQIFNGSASDKALSVSIDVLSVYGKTVYRRTRSLELGSDSAEEVRFAVPELPIGPYAAKITVSDGDTAWSYHDWFGVFIPNNKRINQSPMWFGVQDQAERQAPAESILHLEWMTKLGVDINRIETGGSRFNSDQPLSLELWEPLFSAYEKHNVDILLLFSSMPSNLYSNGGGWRHPPGDYAAFEAYAKLFGKHVAHYPAITYVEFWNEPDIGFFHGTLEDYLKMLKHFYRGFKSEAPHIALTSGGVTVIHPRMKKGFSEGMFIEGVEYYDVANFHAHGIPRQYEERQLLVEQWLEKAGAQKPISNSESGAKSHYDSLEGGLSQAVTLVKKIAYAKSRANSEFYIWFTFQDYWDMDRFADDSYGLITSDNRVKPSFIAYNELIRQLANTVPVGEVTWDEKIRTLHFEREDGKHVYVSWAKDGFQSGSLWLSANGEMKRIDIFGDNEESMHNGVFPISIGRNPVYFVADSEIRLADESERKVQASSEWIVVGEGLTQFPIQMKSSNIELKLLDAEGTVRWSTFVEAFADEEKTVHAELSVSAEGTYPMTLQWGTGEAVEGSFPVTFIKPYLISKTKDGVNGATPGKITLNDRSDVFELSFDPTIPHWKGPEDLSVSAAIAHDGKGLYFLFEVTDDVHVFAEKKNQLWRSDNVQVSVSDGTDYTQFDLGMVEGEPVAWCNRMHSGGPTHQWDIPLEIKRDGNVTRYTCYVPFELLPVSNADEKPSFRIAFLVNENDGQGRVRWMQWYDGVGLGLDVNLHGHVILE